MAGTAISTYFAIQAYRKALETEASAATEYPRLQRSRISLDTTDLKIAASVLAHDATLLSHHFPALSAVVSQQTTAPSQ